MLESSFNDFPSTLYHGSCFKMRGTFPFRYQLIAKAIELTSMVPRKMCNRKGCTAKETNFRKRLWYPPAVITRRGVSHYFWDRVQEKVYDGRCCYPFATTVELNRRICDVWDANQWNSFFPVWKPLTQSKLFLYKH